MISVATNSEVGCLDVFQMSAFADRRDYENLASILDIIMACFRHPHAIPCPPKCRRHAELQTSTARPKQRIFRLLSSATPFFSEAGNQLAIVRNRWRAEVIRSLRPEELAGVLDARVQHRTRLESLAPVKIVTEPPVPAHSATNAPSASALKATETSALLAHVGNMVIVQGRVRQFSLTAARNAANIEFDGDGPNTPLVSIAPSVCEKFAARFGQNPGVAINDRNIQVSGRLGTYAGRRNDWKERLQISLEDPDSIIVLATEPDSGSSSPGKTVSSE